jgi:hypothetical protein
MAAKLTRKAHKIATQLDLVAESFTICSSHSRLTVRKLLDTPSYLCSDTGPNLSLRSFIHKQFTGRRAKELRVHRTVADRYGALLTRFCLASSNVWRLSKICFTFQLTFPCIIRKQTTVVTVCICFTGPFNGFS